MQGLAHEHVVRYIASGLTPDGDPWFAMEWLEGIDLHARLRRGPLSLDETMALGKRVASALGHAHAGGIVHRDVKPHNIYLVGGDVTRVKVLDFGVAKLAWATSLMTVTEGGFLLGSPRYMAPEQARGDRSIDARADVFSLGCVLFECLTGRPPFDGDGLEVVLAKVLFDEVPRVSTVVDIPSVLDELLARMLEKVPAARPIDGAVVSALLTEASEAMDEVTTLVRIDNPPPSREQRWASVLLTGEWAGLSATSLSGDATVTAVELPPLATLASIAQASGARMESLRSGAHLFVWSGGGLANDIVRAAAHASLEIAAIFRETPMALVTGLAAEGSALPVGSALDRAVSKVADARRLGVTRLFVDDATASLLGERFEVLGEPGDLLLVGERLRGAGVRTLLGRETPCVGREAELGKLCAVFDECVAASRAKVMVLAADAGVGKSRLRHELVARVRESLPNAAVWVAECEPRAADSAFGAAASLVRQGLGVTSATAPSVVRAALAERMAEVGLAYAAGRGVQHLHQLLGVADASGHHDDPRTDAGLDSLVLRDQLCAAWVDFVAAESASVPVLLILEDVQWADRPSIALIAHALKNLAHRRVAVLALGRPEFRARFPALWSAHDVHTVELSPLGEPACEALVRAVLGSAILPERVRAIVAHAAGNAFFLEELIRAEADGVGDKVPESVLAMIAFRVGKLDRPARRALRSGSVFGWSFDARGASIVSRGLATPEVLAELEREELIFRLADGRFAFRNAAVREVAYAQFVEEDRQAAHARAAEWLAAVEPANVARIAEHLELAGAIDRAGVWWSAATEQALVGGDFDAVARGASRAEACGVEGEARARMLLAVAEARLWQGNAPERLGLAERVIGNSDTPPDVRLRALGIAAHAAAHLGELERLAAYGQRLTNELDGASPSEGALSAIARCNDSLYLAGLSDMAARMHDVVRAAYARLAKPSGSVRARILLLNSHALRMRPQPNLEAIVIAQQEAAAVLAEVCDVRGASLARLNASYALTQLGAYEDAIAEFRSVLIDAERLGIDYLIASLHQNLGFALGRIGAFDEAVRVEQASVAACARAGNLAMQVGSMVYLTRILTAAGRPLEAESLARGACTMLSPTHPIHLDALAALADALLTKADSGSCAEALELATLAHDALVERKGTSEESVFVRRVYIDALEANNLEARAVLARAEARAWISARASAIQSDRYRYTFVHDEPDNARIMGPRA